MFQAIAIVSLEDQERLILEKSHECGYLIQKESQFKGESCFILKCDKMRQCPRNTSSSNYTSMYLYFSPRFHTNLFEIDTFRTRGGPVKSNKFKQRP